MWNFNDLREEAVSLAETINLEIVRLSKEVNLNEGYRIEVGVAPNNPHLKVGISDTNLTFMQADPRFAEAFNEWMDKVGEEEVATVAMQLQHQVQLALTKLNMDFDFETSLIFTHPITDWSEKDISFIVGMSTPVEWDTIDDERENLKNALRVLTVTYLTIEEGIKDYLLAIIES